MRNQIIGWAAALVVFVGGGALIMGAITPEPIVYVNAEHAQAAAHKCVVLQSKRCALFQNLSLHVFEVSGGTELRNDREQLTPDQFEAAKANRSVLHREDRFAAAQIGAVGGVAAFLVVLALYAVYLAGKRVGRAEATMKFENPDAKQHDFQTDVTVRRDWSKHLRDR